MAKQCDVKLPKARIANDIDYTPDELSSIEARNFRRAARMKNLAEYNPEANPSMLQDLVAEQNIWMNNVAQATHLNPKRARGLGAVMARQFGAEYNILNKLTDAGKVRRTTRNVLTSATARAMDALTKFETMQTIRQVSNNFKRLAGRRIKDAEILSEVWDKAVYFGQTERVLNIAKAGPMAERFLKAEHNRFVDRLQAYGFGNKEINTLLGDAAQIARIHDEAIATVQAAGVTLKPRAMFDYMNSSLTSDARFHIGRKLQQGLNKNDNPEKLIETLMRSRETNEFIVEDEVLLSYVLNKPVDDIRKVVLDDNVLSREFAELNGEHLDWLVDQGILSKMPMPSNRVAKVITQRYNLPYKGLNDVFLTDPVRGYQQYAARLADDYANSTLYNNIAKEGMDRGWAVPGAVMREGGDYSDFVKLPSSKLEDLGDEAKDIYVHPFVADSINAIKDISTNPAKIGSFAQLVHYMSRTFRTMALSTGGYVFHNLFGNFINYYMARGNLLTLIPDFAQTIVQYTGRKTLNKTRKVYLGGKITEQELWDMGVQSGLLSPASNFASDLLAKSTDNQRAWNPKNFPKALGAIGHAFATHGAVPGMTLAAGKVSSWLSETTYPIMWSANYLDTAFKWSLLKTITNPDQAVGAVLSTGKTAYTPDFDKAIKWIEDYFPNYAQVGTTDRRIMQYVYPFWVWSSRNLTNQIRNAVRNPAPFMAYLKIQGILNYPAEAAGDDLPEGGVPEYLLHNRPIFWKDDNGDWFALSTTNFDPIGAALQTHVENLNQAARWLGLYMGTEQEKRDKAEGKDTHNFLKRMLEGTYPQTKTVIGLIEVASGKDLSKWGSSLVAFGPLTGSKWEDAKPTKFLGIDMHPLTRFLIETNIPSAGYGNKIGSADTLEENLTKNLLGFNNKKLEIATQMGYTENDIYSSINDLKKGVKEKDKQLKNADSQEEANKIARDKAELLHHIGVLNYDMQNIKRWRDKRGVPDYKKRKELKQQGIDLEQVTNTSTRN